jgi:hypothetical protein
LGAAAETGTASTGGAASSSSSHYTHGSCRQHAQSSVSTPPATQPAAGVLAYVPWLGLLGCCCLQWSQQLANLPSSATATGAAAAQSGVVLDLCGGVIAELPEGLRNIWGTAV